MKLLGRGGHRIIYLHPDNPEWVIKESCKKIDNKFDNRYNKHEYGTWVLAKEHNIEFWLVPCINLSTCGNYLVQLRGEPCPDDRVPPQLLLPEWLRHDTNLARQWVLINGHPKICDYDHNQYDSLKQLIAHENNKKHSTLSDCKK